MSNFIIMTDSACDLPHQVAEENEILVLPLTLNIQEKSYRNYLDEREISTKEFYQMQRDGVIAKTAAANMDELTRFMKPALEAGKDVLYLAFSSGLSSTCSAAMLAAEELCEQFPERKVFVVDTLSASLGQGLLVYLAAQEKKRGKSIEEVRDFAEQNKLRLCHWFTVYDLNHLKRGGRVSAATAMVGTMLNIKPVLHVDNEGHLIKVETARGRKASLNALVNHMEKTAVDPSEQTIFISHGDCLEEAEALAKTIEERFGVKKPILINPIGPVIGAHSGADTMALFFLGTQR